MEEFVPVRMVQGNGMDLSLFQFDYDMSFAVFFLDADRTVYGRYGTRTASGEGKSDSEISMAGLADSMRAVLALHANKAKYAEALRAKVGPEPRYATPERHPELRRFTAHIDYGPEVAKSCIHCHQIRDSERSEIRATGQPISDRVLFPYPVPDVLGARFDPEKRSTVASVESGSPAEDAGLRAGDEVLAADATPVVSVADLQWSLEQKPGDGGEIALTVDRAGGRKQIRIPLAEGWRRAGDISWRVSTWDLRRAALGGMKLDRIPDGERRGLGLEGRMALRAAHVGQYGDHAVAKQAGAQKGDIVVAFDGVTEDWREADAIAHAVQKRRAGDVIPVKVRRGDRELTLEIRLQ